MKIHKKMCFYRGEEGEIHIWQSWGLCLAQCLEGKMLQAVCGGRCGVSISQNDIPLTPTHKACTINHCITSLIPRFKVFKP